MENEKTKKNTSHQSALYFVDLIHIRRPRNSKSAYFSVEKTNKTTRNTHKPKKAKCDRVLCIFIGRLHYFEHLKARLCKHSDAICVFFASFCCFFVAFLFLSFFPGETPESKIFPREKRKQPNKKQTIKNK